jgi:hypothetical protein
MPKKVIKKHTTHNENKNHIHIHIGDKKRRNRRRKGQGKGSGGGAISVQSVVHPPNIVIPQYNRPQYLDPSTVAGRENSSHFGFAIPTVKHNHTETQNPLPHFTPQQAETGTHARDFETQIPHPTGLSLLGRAIEKAFEKRDELNESKAMEKEDANIHPDSRFGTNPMHSRFSSPLSPIQPPRHDRETIIPRGGRGGRGGGQRQPPDASRAPLPPNYVYNPLTNFKIVRDGPKFKELLKNGIIDKSGNDIRGKND